MEEMFMITYNCLQEKYLTGSLSSEEQKQWEIIDALKQKHYPNSTITHKGAFSSFTKDKIQEIMQRSIEKTKKQHEATLLHQDQEYKRKLEENKKLKEECDALEEKLLSLWSDIFTNSISDQLGEYFSESEFLKAKVVFKAKNHDGSKSLPFNKVIQGDEDGRKLIDLLPKELESIFCAENFDPSYIEGLAFDLDIFFLDRDKKYSWFHYDLCTQNGQETTYHKHATYPLDLEELVAEYNNKQKSANREIVTIFDAKGEFIPAEKC